MHYSRAKVVDMSSPIIRNELLSLIQDLQICKFLFNAGFDIFFKHVQNASIE